MTTTANALNAKQLAMVLATLFADWGDISPKVFEIVALGMAGDESIEDDDLRLDSIEAAKVFDTAAAWINNIVVAPTMIKSAT